jgi:hypothetical protein
VTDVIGFKMSILASELLFPGNGKSKKYIIGRAGKLAVRLSDFSEVKGRATHCKREFKKLTLISEVLRFLYTGKSCLFFFMVAPPRSVLLSH